MRNTDTRQPVDERRLFGYSTTMYIVAGEMLASAAGMRWEELVTTRLFHLGDRRGRPGPRRERVRLRRPCFARPSRAIEPRAADRLKLPARGVVHTPNTGRVTLNLLPPSPLRRCAHAMLLLEMCSASRVWCLPGVAHTRPTSSRGTRRSVTDASGGSARDFPLRDARGLTRGGCGRAVRLA